MRLEVICVFACLVVVSFAGANSQRDLYPPKWKQCDDPWGNEMFGNCSYTICSDGSSLVSLAMYFATRYYGGNPSTLNIWLIKNDAYTSGCDIEWQKTSDLGYGSFKGKQTPAYKEACNMVGYNDGLIAHLSGTRKFALITGCDSDEVYYVADPSGSRKTYRHSEIDYFVVFE